jgi:5-methylcytosine-specific restriction enzyme subunit McrC
MNSPVQIREQRSIPFERIVGAGLSAVDVAVARRAVSEKGRQLRTELGLRSDALVVTDAADGLRLEVRGIAGSVRLGAASLDIRPKHVLDEAEPWQAALLVMLERASKRRLSFHRTTSLSLSSGRTFADRLAMGYAMELEDATRHAEVRSYRGTRAELPHVRGRVLMTEQLRSSLTKPHRVICEVDTLSADNPVNRLLHWAAAQLDAVATDPLVRRRLSVAAGRLPAVTPSAALPTQLTFQLPRQYHHYRGAVELATAFARGVTTVYGASDVGGAGFVVGTERLYESFLEASLLRAAHLAGPDWSVVPQLREPFAHPVKTGHGRPYFSSPDNVVRHRGVVELIIDAKYKRFVEATDRMAQDRPSNADLYQMVAACVAHRCKRALLVYPSQLQGGSQDDLAIEWRPRWWRVPLPGGGDARIGAVAIPLTWLSEPDGVESFDARLRGLMTHSAGAVR